MSGYKIGRRARRAALTACLALAWGTQADAAEWQVRQAASPLTGATSVSATLASTAPLINMIGVPENAALVLRCDGRELAAYVVWPQVLTVGSTGQIFGTTQTMVSWRVDNRPMAVNFWNRSDDGTAAGKFSTGGALKIIKPLAGAHRLVVRMTGRMAQDAVFDLGDIDPVIGQVEQACGVSRAGER